MTQNKILEEINRLAGTAFSSALHAKDALMIFIKEQVEHLLPKDLISRDEFEALKLRVEKLEAKKTAKKKHDEK
jgi:BMFP domain-containing protein YqiC